MTDSNSQKEQKEKAKRFQKTDEAKKLRALEAALDLRLDGIAFFLANNPPIKHNGQSTTPDHPTK